MKCTQYSSCGLKNTPNFDTLTARYLVRHISVLTLYLKVTF